MMIVKTDEQVEQMRQSALLVSKTLSEIAKTPQLEFVEEDIGELPGSKASDDFKDKRNSIYNPFAASERKIQIIAVSFD